MRPFAARSRVRRSPVRRRYSFISSRSGARSLPRTTLRRSNASKTRVSSSIARKSASNRAHSPRPSRRSETSSTSESNRSKGTSEREISGSVRNGKGKSSDQGSFSKKASPLGKFFRVRSGPKRRFNRRSFLSSPSECRNEIQSNLVEGSNIRNQSSCLAAICIVLRRLGSHTVPRAHQGEAQEPARALVGFHRGARNKTMGRARLSIVQGQRDAEVEKDAKVPTVALGLSISGQERKDDGEVFFSFAGI